MTFKGGALAIVLLLWTDISFGQTLEEFNKRYLDSVATSEGRAYESVATAEFTSDLSFMPECARRERVRSGAVTIFFEVTPVGAIGDLYITPGSPLVDCFHDNLVSRKFTPPPGGSWVGRLTLTISR